MCIEGEDIVVTTTWKGGGVGGVPTASWVGSDSIEGKGDKREKGEEEREEREREGERKINRERREKERGGGREDGGGSRERREKERRGGREDGGGSTLLHLFFWVKLSTLCRLNVATCLTVPCLCDGLSLFLHGWW